MTYTMPMKLLRKTQAQPGDQLFPDEWPRDRELIEADAFDKQIFGQDTLRVKTGQELIPTLPVKIRITGREAKYCYSTPSKVAGRISTWKVRCKVEFQHDGESGVSSGAWLYFQA